MKIIIGLGNPGKEYKNTRHNVGFFFLDYFNRKNNFPEFLDNKKFKAQISKGKINNEDYLLVKPQTFMNLSGKSIQLLLDFYKLSHEDILVVHDDLDIPLGKYKKTDSSRSAGHNGIKNIIENLGTQDFRRIRIGIGEEKGGAIVCRLNAHDFVLGKMTKEEEEKIKNLFPEIEKTFDQK